MVNHRYQIEELLGFGEAGDVYACRDLGGDKSRLVAKIMTPMAIAPQHLDNLSRQLALMQRLRHPNLARILDFGVIHNSQELFLVEERLEGSDLFSGTEGMDPENILALILQLSKGLRYLHAREIIHGNLKPSNAMLLKNGEGGERLKLLDFNLRYWIENSHPPGGLGSLSYSAPEVLMGVRADKSSDIYALGILMYQLLTRRLPFEDEDMGFLVQKQLQGSIDMRPLERLRGANGLSLLLRRLLEKDPDKRIASMDEVLAHLGAAIGQKYSRQDGKGMDAHFSAAQFVGRQGEMRLLHERAQHVKESGRGWTIFICGEAGAGKTRCMEEMRSRALLEGWQIVEGACSACDESAYGPYRQILAKTDPKPGESIFRFDNLPRIAESDPFDSSSGFAAGQFQDLLTREMVRRLADRPTILFLHDFHWADKATCAVLDYLSSDIQARPILMCVSLRSGEAAKEILGRVMDMCVRHDRGEILALDPLPKENIQQMVVGMTGDASFQDTLGNWIFRTVGGNPFFLEEMLRHLVEQGVLNHISGKWEFVERKLTNVDAPASIGMVLQKRLAHVSPRARSLASWLALFHRAIPRKLLGMVMSCDVECIEAPLMELVHRQMVRLETATAEETIDFSHELIAEVIRGSLPKKQSQRMHRKIAGVLETEPGTEMHLHELAMHYIEGPSNASSIRYALASATRFRAEFAHENALRCFQHILKSRSGLSKEARCTTAIAASDSMFALGMAGHATRLLKAVLRTSRSIAPELCARMYMQLALSYQYVGDLRRQEQSCNKGLQILRRFSASEPNLTRAMLWAELAFGAVVQSRPQYGLDCLDKALKSCPDQNAVALKGRIQSLYAILYCVACKLQEALTSSARAAEILDNSEESYLTCSAVSTLGGMLMRLGRFRQALENHKQAVALSEKSRSVVLKSQALGNLSECLCRMGRIQEAYNAIDCASTSVIELNNPAIRQAYNAIWAEIKLAAGDYRGARQVLNSLNPNGSERLSLFTIGHACYVAAELNFCLGSFEAALSHINKLGENETKDAPFYEHELAEALRERIRFEYEPDRKSLDNLMMLDLAVTRKRWPYQMCIIKMHICEVLLKQHKLKEAELYAKNALRLATAMQSVPLICHARLLLGRIYSPLRRIDVFANSCEGKIVQIDMHAMADKAISELQLCCQQLEPPCPTEWLWRAHAELSFIYKLLGNFELCFQHAQKAHECLCKLEDQIPSDMLSSFYSVFGRSQIRLELMRLIDAGRKRYIDRELAAGEYYEDENARILLRLSAMANKIQDLNPLLDGTLDQLIPAIAMQRGFVFLWDDSKEKLVLARGRNDVRENLDSAVGISQPILDLVYRQGTPIVSADVATDPRIQSAFQGNKCSGKLLCAALKASGRVIGVLYADHTASACSMSESVIDLWAAACNLAAIAIDNILVRRQLPIEKEEAKPATDLDGGRYPEIVGNSASARALKDRIGLAADSPLDILITGESGTGKELVARAISRTGRRRQGKFVPVDCGSLSDSLAEAELFGYRKGAFTGATENRQGLLESANGGIVFLDEISNMPMRLQAKLLRVLQEREVRRIGETIPRKLDIQIIAATNKDLMKETRCGRFRGDLFYRLKSMEIRVPSLRERSEDIPLLIEWFLRKTAENESGRLKQFAPESMKLLIEYSYPGNIRELKNTVSACYYSTPGISIGSAALPPEVRSTEFTEIRSDTITAARLYREIQEGKGGFEDLVKEPYQNHQFGIAVMRGVIQLALRDAGGSYRNALKRLRVPASRYSPTIQFLKRQKCYLDFRPFRRNPPDSSF